MDGTGFGAGIDNHSQLESSRGARHNSDRGFNAVFKRAPKDPLHLSTTGNTAGHSAIDPERPLK